MAVLCNTGIRAGASGVTATDDTYRVKRSARFNDGDGAYLNGGLNAMSGTQTTFTYSTWIKLADGGNHPYAVHFSTDNPCGFAIVSADDGRMTLYDYDHQYSTRLFRDPSAWYHIVVSVNSATASLYVNGELETLSGTPDDFQLDSSMVIGCHDIGVHHYNGYMADIHLIDGAVKAPTEFAETDSTTGQWVPKEYTGSYGTNGFHLAMDPANGGTMYSSFLTDSQGGETNAQRVFDGGIALESHSWSSSGGPIYTFAPDPAISYSSKVEIYLDRQNYAQINGGGYTQYAADAWHELATGSGTLTTIQTKYGADSGGHASLSAVRVDGKILVDHSAIGYDSSGNGNHWHENNIFGHEATVGNANFKAIKYTGTGSSLSVSGVGFQPDMVWFKSTSNAYNHAIFDVVRGVEKRLQPNKTQAEDDSPTGLTAFNSDGFTVGSNNVNGASSVDYVAWCWKAGGAASSNSDGSITSTVSANPDAGFSIVKWNSSSSVSTVGHGLGKAPKMIITKNMDASNTWWTYHEGVGNTHAMRLDTTDAKTDQQSNWNDTSPTSSVFTVGGEWGNGNDIIGYCWSEIEGYSKFGQYLGTGTSGYPNVVCGFTPAFILIKRATNANDWTIYDTARDSVGVATNELYPNTDGAQWSSGPIEITADGFKINCTHTHLNAASNDYIFAAFAGAPQGALDLLADAPGAPYDNSLNGGGNYCTLNTLDSELSTNTNNGNLNTGTAGTSAWELIKGTIGVSSGKWYWEGKCEGGTTSGSSGYHFGVMLASLPPTDGPYATGCYTHQSTKLYQASNETTITDATLTTNAWALDLDANTLKFYRDGVLAHTYTSVPAGTYTPFGGSYGSALSVTFNFGQQPFKFTPPAGYKALNTYNLPTPTIVKGNTGFDAKLFTGTGSSQSITGLEFEPDLVWIKSRSAHHNHHLFDQIRSATKVLYSNSNAAEGTEAQTLTAFTSDGFTVGTDSSVNENGTSFVGWAWDAGSSSTTNDASSTGIGTVDSTYRVNTNTGFSIVSFNSGSSGQQTVAHGLNAVPKLIITKNRESANSWVAYHPEGTGLSKYILPSGTAAASTSSDIWGTSNPTSTVFGYKSGSNMNADEDIIAYCWSEVAGYSKIGSWTSTGNDFIYCGFKPKFLLGKCTSDTGDWMLYDTERGPLNQDADNNTLVVNVDKGEDHYYNANQASVDILSNGFKIRHAVSSPLGDTGRTYIFAAFAESPFKYANAR